MLPFLCRFRQWLLIALLFAPNTAHANAFWPPVLYFYAPTIWWVVPIGLALELSILSILTRRSISRSAVLVVIANLASSAMGFLVFYPVVFWDSGIDWLVNNLPKLPAAIAILYLGLFLLVLLLNTLVEWAIIARLTRNENLPRLFPAVLLANLASAIPIIFGMNTLLKRAFQ